MKKIIIFLTILSTLLMTGCWDMVEIEDRTLPYSIGMDTNSNKEKEGKYQITMTYPNIAAIGKNAKSDEPVHVLSDTGDSIFALMHRLTIRLQRPIYLKLLNVILFSEDVAKDSKSMKEILDGLNRDFIVSKNVQMLVTKDSSKELLEAASKLIRQQSIEGYLYSMLVNRQEASMFIPINFNDFIEKMDISNAAIVPLATPGEEEVIISGGALFKDYRLIGYLQPMEVRSIAFINSDINEDTVDTEFKGANLSVMITNVNSKKNLENKDDDIKIKYDIELEGHIHSFILGKKMAIETEEMLKDMQDTIARDIKEDIDKVVAKLQKEYRADILQIGDYIRKYHPKLWKEIQRDWEEIYPDIDIDIDVKVFIRRRGLTK